MLLSNELALNNVPITISQFWRQHRTRDEVFTVKNIFLIVSAVQFCETLIERINFHNIQLVVKV